MEIIVEIVAIVEIKIVIKTEKTSKIAIIVTKNTINIS